MILLIGLALTAGLGWTLHTAGREAINNRFQSAAAERAGIIVDQFKDSLRDLDSIRRFFDGSTFVSRDEFRRFVTPILDYHGFQALEWLPHVLLDERADYETAARNDGLTGFQFTERNAQGALIPASDRPEYFPVFYLEPYAGNEAALGFTPDSSHPARGAALTEAWESGQPIATGRYILVQEQGQRFSVLVFAPVYRELTATSATAQRERLRGFVLGVLRIGDAVESALQNSGSSEPDLSLRVLDRSAGEREQLLFQQGAKTGSVATGVLNSGGSIPDLSFYLLGGSAGESESLFYQSAESANGTVPAHPLFHYAQDFPFAGRLWRVEVNPGPAFISSYGDWSAYWVVAAGLLLTLLTALYGATLASQRHRAEALVAVRTAELRASEEYFRLLYEQAPVAYQSLDIDGRIIEVNPCWQQLFGYDREEVTGHWVGDFLAPDQWPLLDQQLAGFKTTGLLHDARIDFLHRDRRRIPVMAECRVSRNPAGGFQQTHCILYDLTERQRAEQRQRLASAVFEAVRESIIVTDPRGLIVAVNPAFTALSGYSETEVLGKNPRFLQSGRQSDAFYDVMWETLQREDSWHGEFWNRRKDGDLYVALATISAVRDIAGRLTYYVGIATDITRQKEAEQRIERLAYYDALTGLANRALLIQRADQALTAQRGKPLALLFVDIDPFKKINDSFGHTGGDALLLAATSRLRGLLRETDTACRLGSDEFVLLLPGMDQAGARQLADQVLTVFRQPFAVAGHSLRATVSIGIALYPHDGASFTDLLKNADAALHRAKQEGRNTCLFYAREMNVAALERLMLESELRHAIDGGQLVAYFQPKVHLADGALAGAEALVRWRHPAHGLIPPGRFVPVAETSDLIVALGDWMLEAVCRQLAIWRDAGLPPLTVAVNLAARHFRDPGLIRHIQNLLKIHRLNPNTLELELTESTLLETGAQTGETLAVLKRLGVGLAIDDFGTGYSSLGYLKRMPITALKIDQSFVRDLVTDQDDRTLAATIVALGHGLGLSVVAEGVETEEQRQILLDQGCDLAQGYYFGRPMSADQFADWVNNAGDQV